jgi:outer membrane protein
MWAEAVDSMDSKTIPTADDAALLEAFRERNDRQAMSVLFARHADAAYRAQAQEQTTRDLENRVARDVTVAWLDARTSYQRLDLTSQLLAQASDALDLAQARYNLGLSSIVELTQAQLNKTAAEIGQATARYDYQIRAATLRYQTGELK